MPKRVDNNQKEIVDCMRNLGASVAVTSDIGKGFPDLVVGWQGRNLLVELKSVSKKKDEHKDIKKKLTPCEKKFHDEWRGKVNIVTSIDEAIELIMNNSHLPYKY